MLNTLSEKADFYQKYEEEVNQLINMDEISCLVRVLRFNWQKMAPNSWSMEKKQ